MLGFCGHPERGPVERVAVRWAEERVCMLADTAPGAGRLGSGWEDVANALYVDEPTHWRPITEER